MYELNEAELEELYSWVDQIPLSRPKRNMARDFSDGVLIAEVIRHYLPKMIEIHNYSPANSNKQKMDNWLMLNRKVFSKLNFELSDEVLWNLSCGKANIVERVLALLRAKIDGKLADKKIAKRSGLQHSVQNDKPEAEQDIASPGRNKNTDKRAVKKVSDMIPKLQFEEKEQECLLKEETIKILQAKITRLEHLLKLKDMRIEEMQQKLENVRPTGRIH